MQGPNQPQPPAPDQPQAGVGDPGWYPDPERAHTQRYWDGKGWTEQRAPSGPTESAQVSPEAKRSSGWTNPDGTLNLRGGSAVGLVLAGIGAAIAIIGVFLPEADSESSIHIASNSLIQHAEGAVAIAIALAGFFTALRPSLRPLTFLCGAALVGLAALAGTNLPIHYRNDLSEALVGQVSAGIGIYAVGIGGVLLALSAAFGGSEEELADEDGSEISS
jgi:hypothetical protein